MRPTIGVFGGSFNPPTIDHLIIAEKAAAAFGKLVILPCGMRPDKSTTNSIATNHRINLVILGFAGLPSNVSLIIDDVAKEHFTPTWQLQQQLSRRGEIWHIVGADLVQGGSHGQSEIQLRWQHGQAIWQWLNFGVVTRCGYPLSSDDLPPHHQLLDWQCTRSSTQVRQRSKAGQPIDGLVIPSVADYIAKHHLFCPEEGSC
jgi:nicotinate (nicotinamide) nucleotide adenylyltransferase